MMTNSERKQAFNLAYKYCHVDLFAMLKELGIETTSRNNNGLYMHRQASYDIDDGKLTAKIVDRFDERLLRMLKLFMNSNAIDEVKSFMDGDADDQ